MASRSGHNFLSWPHREQDASTNNNKRSVQGKSDTTGVISKHPIRKKAQQDVGLFYYLCFRFKSHLDVHQGYELKSLKITSINIEKVIKCGMFHTLFFSSKIFL